MKFEIFIFVGADINHGSDGRRLLWTPTPTRDYRSAMSCCEGHMHRQNGNELISLMFPFLIMIELCFRTAMRQRPFGRASALDRKAASSAATLRMKKQPAQTGVATASWRRWGLNEYALLGGFHIRRPHTRYSKMSGVTFAWILLKWSVKDGDKWWGGQKSP